MMTLEQIRERNRKENAAARRLQAAGYRLEGWDPRTGHGCRRHCSTGSILPFAGGVRFST